jgi:hypothetical protein
MNMQWRLKRLRAMGAREVGHRGARFVHARLERTGLLRVRPKRASAERGRAWLQELPRHFDTAPYRLAAERILEGRFLLFGREFALGWPPDWNRDPATRIRAPLTFGKSLNYRDARRVGNIKYLWEPNRHLELVTLAQAWRLTGEARFAHGCRVLLDSWIEQCPYLLGPNWTSSLELALRLLNWSCAWHLLGGDAAPLFEGSEGASFKERWLAAVRQHCHFVAGHLSRYSSANNHLLGELLGLFVGATTWRAWPESEAWRSRALREFEQEAQRQNCADGVNREQAIWYQHEVADMMLLVGLTARANGTNLGHTYWARLEAMLEFVAACMDVAGNVPAIGDADDAVMVRFAPAPDFAVYRSLLATGAVLFGRADFKRKAREFDDKTRWLLGDAAQAQFESLEDLSAASRIRRAYPEGGYYVLGGDFDTARETRLIVDAAPLGYLAIAAHGHADALSFTLSVAGRPMLIDPGTYVYHTEPRWRDYFRGTSAHNTLRIDGLDQSVAGGAFLWTQRASARCIAFEPGALQDRFLGEHDGYTRLRDPVVHRREIRYEHTSRIITVEDQLICRGPHHIEIFWHFGADCAAELAAQAAHVVSGPVALAVTWPPGLEARRVRGNADLPQGWVSRRFDDKTPADCLVVSGAVPGGWRGVSTLAIGHSGG